MSVEWWVPLAAIVVALGLRVLAAAWEE